MEEDKMMRDTLFICHATPSDNEFAIWLASRLEMLGYKTWIDKNYLLGGERMWQVIQNVLENNAIKVLFVYSKNIRDYNRQIRQGIFDELSYANSISKRDSLKDFIIPLHIDDSSYSEIIGFDGVTQISFKDSWAFGLKELINKLEKQNVIKQEVIKSSISSWYENEYLDCCKIINREEQYFSSWWEIIQIPEKIYIHNYKNRQQADMINEKYRNIIPIGKISNNITTFEYDLQVKCTDGMFDYDIKAEKIFTFTKEDILNGISSIDFPTTNDLHNHFTFLLKQVFSHLMREKGMWRYKLSMKTAFYSTSNKIFKFIKFIYPDSEKAKSKKIGGKYYSCFWNYAISSKPILSPIIGFSIQSHLVFTKDGKYLVTDENFQSTHRRSKAKGFYNSDWRDLLLAFIQNLKDEENEIKIKVTNNNEYVKFSLWPKRYNVDFGYIEPFNDINSDKDGDNNE